MTLTDHTQKSDSAAKTFDLLVIGGGVNGCGIARDAAGRGLSVFLCEKDDLAQATSSASTKLFHGGLRYLEFFEFRLVRKALREREVLLKAMPHIAWPMRFVLPYDPNLKYPKDLSTLGKAMHFFLPFLHGRRPAWLVRSGLFLYDHLGGRNIFPATTTLNLKDNIVGTPLKPQYEIAYEYSDCWVNDARLVVLNARDACDRGAEIHTRTKCLSAERDGEIWRVSVQNQNAKHPETINAKCIVNAAGPWVDEVLNGRLRQNSTASVRLVRGSHIVVNKLFDHDQPYFFQLSDGRIIFAIPYENDFTLIGTTDLDHNGDPNEAKCTQEEMDYLIAATNQFFEKKISPEDVVWTYSGVRPLYDDHSGAATTATRDYVLTVQDEDETAPLLNVFGGKITTYRKLSEEALTILAKYFPAMSETWTEHACLPGGDFPYDAVEIQIRKLRSEFDFLDRDWATRLVRSYGTLAAKMLGNAEIISDLGQEFGASLFETEVRWLIEKEWAWTVDDIIWRRSKLGLRLTAAQVAELEKYLVRNVGLARQQS